MTDIGLLTVFVLSVFIGFEVVSKVSTTLHTPLMSGAILVTGSADGAVEITLGLIAVVLSTVNMVGGFVVTDRMLEMFRGRKPAPKKADTEPEA